MTGFYVEDGLFVAPLDAPYAKALEVACWRKDGRKYYTDELSRVIPVIEHASPELIEKLMGTKSDFALSSAVEPSRDFVVPLPEGKKLFGYQLADVEFIIGRHSTLLAEDAGMGKSAIMIGAANYLNAKNILIICPAVAKYNWMLKEWPKWTTLSHLSIGVAEANEWSKTDVVIINYDIIDRHKKLIQERHWDLLIVDESHRIKNPDAKRTKLVLGGTMKVTKEKAEAMGLAPSRKKDHYKSEAIKSKKRIFASATPMNRPKDLWTMAESCDPDGLGSNWKTFHIKYCAMTKTPFGLSLIHI